MFRERAIRVEQSGRALILTLAQPAVRNALSSEMMEEVTAALKNAQSQPSVRAVIIASDGSVFSAGHDLKELTGREEKDYRNVFELCTDMMLAIQDVPVPVVAEVQGLATAAGCQLAAACDLAVASTNARFATPGVKIGLFCTTPMVPLIRAIGRKRAMEMLLTGQPIDAQTAMAWGLINRVVAPENLRRTTLGLIEQIAAASAETVAIGKKAFYAQIDMNDQLAYDSAKETMTSNALSPDAQEGISAFLAKRTPVWRS